MTRLEAQMISSTGVTIARVTTKAREKGFRGGHCGTGREGRGKPGEEEQKLNNDLLHHLNRTVISFLRKDSSYI